jgi:hypothetical protein
VPSASAQRWQYRWGGRPLARDVARAGRAGSFQNPASGSKPLASLYGSQKQCPAVPCQRLQGADCTLSVSPDCEINKPSRR